MGEENDAVLKQTLAFLQILLLPVWQSVELNATHLKKILLKQTENLNVPLICQKSQLNHFNEPPSTSYLEVLVRQVILQAQRVHALWQRFPSQLLDGVLLLAELGQGLFHQDHLLGDPSL